MLESELHKQICTYIKLQYPNVIFNTDLSGIKTTIGQGKQLKALRSSNGFPDIQILEPRGAVTYEMSYENEEQLATAFAFCGLFLEVKKETPYKKNKELKKMIRYENINGVRIAYDHLQRQFKMHEKLRKRGYMVIFVWTFEMAKQMIDEYLNIKN